jgi:beta-phosphoglucomutase
MIKAILFDLDGVLVWTQKLQILSTISALKKYCKINDNIKEIIYQTITTQEKLKILADGNYLNKNDLINIYKEKKKKFNKEIKKRKIFSKKIFLLLKYLKFRKYKVAVVTNSNKFTTMLILRKLKIKNFLDLIVTNSLKVKPKPNAGPYKYAITRLRLKKENCLILEDSLVGILSAQRSGARYHKIKKPSEVNLKNIKRLIKKYS